MAIALKHHDVLVAVDVQYDFLPGGSLAVAGGDEIIPMINAVGTKFQHVVMTQDWHPDHHISFASSYVEAKPFEVIEVPYGPQVLWPDHCVWDTPGAQFHKDLASAADPADHPQGLSRDGRFLFGLPGGGPRDQDRS